MLAGSGETAVVMVDWTSPHRLGVHDGFFLVPLIPKPEPKPSLDEQLARRIIEEGQMIEWVGQVGLVRSELHVLSSAAACCQRGKKSAD